MEFIKHDINIDWVGKNRIAIILSMLLMVAGLVVLGVRGPNYGIDFAGGTLIQVQFGTPTSAVDIKNALQDMDLGGVVVQQFGDQANEFLVRAQRTSSELERVSEKVQAELEKTYGEGKVDIRRVEMVGPQVGKDLREKGLLAVVYAMIGTLIYIAWRFEFRFAIGAILALLHDVLITLGFFAFFNKEIDLPIIAAFLAIIGYSLNDTIIIYDRIRENVAKYSREGFATVVNRSINETLARTVMTVGTTLLVIVALFIFGGGVIHNFAFAMLVGVISGTFSTIFVASAFAIWVEKRRSGKVDESPARRSAS